jgi:hypothetical protein
MSKNAITIQKTENGFAYSRMIKKSIGSFYTPRNLAEQITREALEAWLIKQGGIHRADISSLDRFTPPLQRKLLKDLQAIKILDPSVGAGVFLIAAADWLNKMRVALGDTMAPIERTSHIVNNSLFGVDLAREAIDSCKRNLLAWVNQGNTDSNGSLEMDLTNIRFGNSLIGFVNHSKTVEPSASSWLRESIRTAKSIETDEFHWFDEFNDIMQDNKPGFDVILGNPPYGNLFTDREKKYIESTYSFNVNGGSFGTWNSAAHFIVRSKMLMKEGGQLGFLVPNSVLRVYQFSKVRHFLLDELRLWKIVDEGSPFDDVTLEMVSIFCEATKDNIHEPIEVESRRPEHEQSNQVDWSVFKSSRVFSIYHDSIYQKILKRGKRNLLVANRGRDIPKEHVSRVKSRIFKTPYITSGRSVRRYQINTQFQYYTDDWYVRDKQLRESFENEILVATKNFRYPRCVIKPSRSIHGGGIVKITPLFKNANIRVLGLILNSRLIRYICVRYLTNYSQLTTCLNTGIMDDLPIVIPKHGDAFVLLFDILSQLYSLQSDVQFYECSQFLERLSNALVYELYFSKAQLLQKIIEETVSEEKPNQNDPFAIYNCLQRKVVLAKIDNMMNNSTVREIEDRLGAE